MAGTSVYDRRSVVGLARTQDTKRDAAKVYRVVKEALDLHGGMGRFVRPGQTVFIKPNQTLFFLADEGVTTDPWVVAALARLALEAGAARAQVGDMPGAGVTPKEVMSITGMDDAVRKAGAEVVYLDQAEQKPLRVPDGRVVDEIWLPAPIVDADVLINAPKAKTHFVDRISGALKNWMGAMRPDVRMRHHDVETPEYVVDCISARPPDLHVVDALIAGEGNGPGANTPRWVGCVLASADPVATDVVTAQLLGFDPSDLVYAKVAAERGLGQIDPARLELVGASVEDGQVPVTPATVDPSFSYLGPVRVIVGDGVSWPGTIGHFKSVADIWHKDRNWELIAAVRGKPTIMIGAAEDPEFEQHLSEGPYVTVDDAVADRYKLHQAVKHVPGHPVCDEMMFRLIEALGVKLPAMTLMSIKKFWTNLQSERKY
jgi:uncharacterized protein (DUF362 family)